LMVRSGLWKVVYLGHLTPHLHLHLHLHLYLSTALLAVDYKK
jgi:hypothetical protein